MKKAAVEHDVDKWERELRAGGWVAVGMTLWRAPNGALLRGPFHAWQVMKSHEQWGGEPESEFTVTRLGPRPLTAREKGGQ